MQELEISYAEDITVNALEKYLALLTVHISLRCLH